MKWIPGYRSDDVEDRRGSGGGGMSLGGAGLLGLLFRLFGLPGLLIGGALLFFGNSIFGGSGGGGGGRSTGSPSAAPGEAQDPQAEMVSMVSSVFDDTQRVWDGAFKGQYRKAKLVLFSDRTSSGCGTGQAAMGPFYCPRDQRVYIDLSFYRDLKQRFGAPGDFAQAYVIAHEVGHHVQHLLGLDEKVHRAARGEQTGADALSVRLELQADCLAGAWAHATGAGDLTGKGDVALESGDIEEALRAAAAIGDDRLQQQQGQGSVTPETWTHGSSEQRVRWFKRGYESGSLESCDTFSASQL